MTKNLRNFTLIKQIPKKLLSKLMLMLGARIFVKYFGGCSVLRGDIISTVEGDQYCGGISSVLLGYHKYFGGMPSIGRYSETTVD